jgi:hypothetical protein
LKLLLSHAISRRRPITALDVYFLAIGLDIILRGHLAQSLGPVLATVLVPILPPLLPPSLALTLPPSLAPPPPPLLPLFLILLHILAILDVQNHALFQLIDIVLVSDRSAEKRADADHDSAIDDRRNRQHHQIHSLITRHSKRQQHQPHMHTHHNQHPRIITQNQNNAHLCRPKQPTAPIRKEQHAVGEYEEPIRPLPIVPNRP